MNQTFPPVPGVSVLLLCGLIVSAGELMEVKTLTDTTTIPHKLLLSSLSVLSFSPPAPLTTPLLHLVVVIPYCISTFLMMSIHKSMIAGHQPVSTEMVQDRGRDHITDEDYYATINVTTEREI
ncbi:hypothetical protein EXN66_Car014074 [Channa argus]|uniref:Uncharacterized protein n=1 Tax=Channa argus TaxID=215402 RepID=A0A6G1Q7T8_CHAAH|nr:hypothetical protein EXN66_Car014074 [Channa argus]